MISRKERDVILAAVDYSEARMNHLSNIVSIYRELTGRMQLLADGQRLYEKTHEAVEKLLAEPEEPLSPKRRRR